MPQGQEGALVMQIAMIVIIIAIFYFLIIRPQRKQEKQVRDMLAALKNGDEVVTIGGIIGTVSNIKDDVITIEVGADKTKMKMQRWSIKEVITKEEQ